MGKTHPEHGLNHSGRGQGTVVATVFTSAPWPTANTWPLACLPVCASTGYTPYGHFSRHLAVTIEHLKTMGQSWIFTGVGNGGKWQVLILTVTEGANCPIQNRKWQRWTVEDIPAFPSSFLAFTPRKYFRNDTTNGEDTVWISADSAVSFLLVLFC